MKLTRYNMFLDEICRKKAARAEIQQIAVARWHDNAWFDEKNECIEDTQYKEMLDITRKHEVHWRIPKSKEVYFFINKLDCVVKIDFRAPPKSATQARIDAFLGELVENSLREFKATHHDLTGLMNRDAFSLRLKAEIAAIAEISGENEEEKIGTNQTISLISIDIDHFKQVNDTYGHLYGDIVLRALALRLDQVAREVEGEFGIKCLPAHPSGEEFLILLSGSLSAGVDQQVAETVRQAVESKILPSDDEWGKFRAAGLINGAPLPPTAERRVTISVGFVTSKGGIKPQEVDNTCDILKRHADAALYRAKANGRNIVVNFDNIIQNFGKILEHDVNNDVVCVDIGRNVGVKVGQEFLVFYPTFSGNSPFIRNDGRSVKILGVYPKLHCGRLEVFNSQAEISFAIVQSREGASPFPAGAHLEAVPLGTISHLVTDKSSRASAILGRSDLEVRVSELARGGKVPFSIVFTIADMDKLLENHGAAFVNRLLAELHEAVRLKFPRNISVGQIEATKIAIVGPPNRVPDTESILSIISDIEERHKEYIQIRVGIFDQAAAGKFEEARDLKNQEDTKLVTEGTIQFAQYAAAAAEGMVGSSDKVLRFSPRIPSDILYQSRNSEKLDQFMVDYENLKSLNAITVNCENQRGLVYLQKGELDKANEVYKYLK